MSRIIADWCKRNHCVSDEEYAVVLYGLEVMFNTSLKLIGIILIGILLGSFREVLLSMIVFCSMRYWAGGWHSDTHLGCFSTMLAFCVSPSFLKGIEEAWVTPVWIGMIAYSLFKIFRYAPQNSKVNPITDEKILRRKRIGSIAECVALVILVSVCQNTALGWLVIAPLFFEAVTLSHG